MNRLKTFCSIIVLAGSIMLCAISPTLVIASDDNTPPQGEPRGGGKDTNKECIEILVISGVVIIWDSCTGEILHVGV